MTRLLSIWIAIIIALLSVAATAVFVVVPRIPVDHFKPEINTKLSQALGRQVSIDGPLRLRVVPQLAVSIQDVKIENMAGGSQPLMARIDALNLQASFFPLLQGKIDVGAIVLNEPNILLEIGRDGTANWSFTPAPVDQTQSGQSVPTIPPAEDGSAAVPSSDPLASSPSGAGLEQQLTRLDIRDFRINKGRVTYLDQRSGYRQTLTLPNLKGSLSGSEQRLTLTGALGWQSLEMAYDLELSPISAFLNGGLLSLGAELNAGKALTSKVNGRLQLAPNLGFEGQVEVASDRLPDLLEMAGLEIDQARQLRGPLAAKGDLIFVDGAFAFSNASFSADLPAVAANFGGRLGYQNAAPNAAGRFSLQVKDAGSLMRLVPDTPSAPRPPLDGSLSASGDLLLVGQDFDLSSAVLDAALNWGRLQYDGQVSKRAALIATQGQLNADVPDLTPVMDWARGMQPGLPQVSGSAKAQGKVAVSGGDFSLLGAKVEARTNLGELLFNGDLQSVGDQRYASGSYAAQANDLQALLALVPAGLLTGSPGLAQLSGSLRASGRLEAQDQRLESRQTQVEAQTSLGSLTMGGDVWIDGAQGQSLDQQLGLAIQTRADIPAFDQVANLFAPGVSTGFDEATRLTFESAVQHQGGVSQLDNTQLALSNGLVSASFNGQARYSADAVSADGRLAAQGRSLRALAKQYGVELPGKPEVYGPFSLQGQLQHSQTQTRFEEATLNLDGLALRLAALLDLGQAKPYIQANLAAPKLALDPYLSAQDHQPLAAAQGANRGAAAGGSDWDTAPIDWSGLQALNGDFALNSQGLSLYGFDLEQAEMTASLRDGRLQADIPSLRAYQGSGSGTFVLNAREAEPSLAVKAKVSQVDIKPLFQALAGREELTGRGDLEIDVLTFGINQARLMSNLKGVADLNLRDGSLLGFDVPATIATLKSRQLDPALGRTRVTQFGDLGARALIEQGVLSTQGFQLTSDKVALTGKGQVDLGKRTLNYRIEPRLTPEYVQAERLTPGISKLTLPLQIYGPWNDLRIQMDLTGFLTLARENPEALLDLIPRDLAQDILPSDFDLEALVSERRLQANQLLQDQAAQAEALRRQAEDAAAQRAAELAAQADRLRAEAEARALEQAQRLRDAQQSLEESAGQAVDNLLDGLFQ